MTAVTATLSEPSSNANAVPAYAQGKPYAGQFPMIAREGWPLVALFAFISGVLTFGALLWHPIAAAVVGVIGQLLTLWCVWFFRDPLRRTPSTPNAVICPADGVVVKIEPGTPPPELGLAEAQSKGMTKLSIFMNVFNVHVNRSPVSARLARIAYKPGAFFNASFDKASELNERCSYALALDDGRTLAMVQIAGLVARRIVVKTAEGVRLKAGERYGLIRFGSRVDLYFPQGSNITAKLGDKTVAGETILGTL
jgi:phosphatidylserine decarboxylase